MDKWKLDNITDIKTTAHTVPLVDLIEGLIDAKIACSMDSSIPEDYLELSTRKKELADYLGMIKT